MDGCYIHLVFGFFVLYGMNVRSLIEFMSKIDDCMSVCSAVWGQGSVMLACG
jgi:hypothetical protein